MRIGVPREIKSDEYRAGLIPSTVAELVASDHHLLVETGAGASAGIDDTAYAAAGAEIVGGPAPIFTSAELIVKVKESLGAERCQLRSGQIIFTYLHLAPDPA